MLTKIKFAPGIDKQDTAVGAEGRWVDSDNVRFRYGLPEKVGVKSLSAIKSNSPFKIADGALNPELEVGEVKAKVLPLISEGDCMALSAFTIISISYP